MIDRSVGNASAAIATILRHRAFIARTLGWIASDLTGRAHDHDLTKLEPDMLPGFCDVNAGSRTERSAYAVTTHTTTETHHPDAHIPPSDMGWLDIIEMVCDWHAAAESYKHNDDAYGFAEGVRRELDKREWTPAQHWLIQEVAHFLLLKE